MTYPSPDTIDVDNQGFLAVLKYLNDVTLGVFPVMFMLTIYSIGIIVGYKTSNDFPMAMAVSGFACFVIGLLFWLGGLLSGVWFSIAIALMILGVAVLIFDK